MTKAPLAWEDVMPDEFIYTFRQHSIVLTRDREDANWYIRVRGPDGLHKYDGYWRDSAGKPLKDALYEAKVGAMLLRAAQPMDPEAVRTAGVEGPQPPRKEASD